MSSIGTVKVELPGDAPMRLATAKLNEVSLEVERARLDLVEVQIGELGLDPRDWPGAATPAEVNRWERAVRRFERLDVLTTVRLVGRAGGPALRLLLAADRRTGEADAVLFIPSMDRQRWPGMEIYWALHRLGMDAASRLFTNLGPITAAEAREVGLLDEICSAARVIETEPDEAHRAGWRNLLRDAGGMSYDEALGLHLAACDRLLRLAPGGGSS
jgi:isomerase DpgB